MRPTSMTALVSLLALAALPECASAIPVVSGSGDTVSYVADLPTGSPIRKAGKPLVGDTPTTVGYKHHRYHIFWMPVWTSTSEGQFVAYHESGLVSTWYVPLGTNPQEVSAKTGVPESELTIPWTARHPWGIYLLIGGLVIWGVAKAVAAKWNHQQRHKIPDKIPVSTGWDEDIHTRFPDWGTHAALVRWLDTRQRLSVGQAVCGTVIARAPFGVWVDIGVGHPALLLAPEMARGRVRQIRFEEYPAVGSVVETRIMSLGERAEISLSQHPPATVR